MRPIDADALIAKFESAKQGSNLRDTLYLCGVQAVIENFPTLESPRDWTPCADGQNLPQSEKQVLLTCISDNKRIYECKGYYLAKHSKEIGCADDLESDYDEETDINYCPEGFYECIENWGDYSFVYINDTVLAWQPLPAAWKEPENV